MKEQGWIKLHRKLRKWEWYQDSQVVHLFLHLLLSANHETKNWQGQEVKKGQLITGRKSLADSTGISEQSIRTGLDKLKKSNEIVIKSTNKFSIITIIKWEEYQVLDNELTNNQPATNQQLTTNKNVKNVKNNISKDILVQLSKIFDFPFKENKTAYNDLAKLIKRFGDKKNLLAFARESNSFEDFPYVIESPGALYRKADKIEARLKKQKDIEKDKMYYGTQEVKRINNQLKVKGPDGNYLEFGGHIKDIINYKR